MKTWLAPRRRPWTIVGAASLATAIAVERSLRYNASGVWDALFVFSVTTAISASAFALGRPQRHQTWILIGALTTALFGFFQAGLIWLAGGGDEPHDEWGFVPAFYLGLALLAAGLTLVLMGRSRPRWLGTATIVGLALILANAAVLVFGFRNVGDGTGFSLVPGVILVFGLWRLNAGER